MMTNEIVKLIWGAATLAVAFGPAFAVMVYFDKKERREAETALELGHPAPNQGFALLQWAVVIAVFLASGFVAKPMFDLMPVIDRALR